MLAFTTSSFLLLHPHPQRQLLLPVNTSSSSHLTKFHLFSSSHASSFISPSPIPWNFLNLTTSIPTSSPSINKHSTSILACGPSSSSSSSSTVTAPTRTSTMKWTSNAVRKAFLDYFAHHPDRPHPIQPSASLIPSDPTILLTIAGMVPFKPIFLGQAPPPPPPLPPRATTAQKCIRTNDIDNVGRTNRHQTFFEMLGNFSFGDYFKKEACLMAWQILTEVYGLSKDRLWVSVLKGDEETVGIWTMLVGVPKHKVIQMSEDSNFWASGPTGPCGPCSEVYYDFKPELQHNQDLPIDLDDDTRFLEVYNLVFMELNQDANGTRTPLKMKNIDTGLGLERLCSILQDVPNNYETDLMSPIIHVTQTIAAIEYQKAPPQTKLSFKVIADHARACVHLIADGVKASNIGRGYILRRLVRRMIRHGRLLGITAPFVHQVANVAIDLAIPAGYTNLQDKRNLVLDQLQAEEDRFLTTLDRGESKLKDALDKAIQAGAPVLPGPDVFELYDTFGFPLELTEEAAQERGLQIDRPGFDRCMQEQRDRARAARTETDLTALTALAQLANQIDGGTQFLGYQSLVAEVATVKGIVLNDGESVEAIGTQEAVRILLDKSPFYAEGGGQVADTGSIHTLDLSCIVQVLDVRKESGAWVHLANVLQGTLTVGASVRAQVDKDRRRRIKAHHTATHLLQSALKIVLDGLDISQAGSLVDSERLRFDFNCNRALTDDELLRIEDIVNAWIGDTHPLQVQYMSLDDAIKAGAVAMFGEKYDKSSVRVVDVPGVSMELCGGTHVANTSEIGLFKIVSETGIAAGVRRIEAVCGAAVLPYLTARDNTVKSLCGALKVRPEEVTQRVLTLQNDIKTLSKRADDITAELAVLKSMALAQQAIVVGGIPTLVATLENVSTDALKVATEALRDRLDSQAAAVLLACSHPNGCNFVAAFAPNAQKKGLNAGKLIGAVAKLCGGGGGGKPGLAQAGGKNPEALPQALEFAREEINKILVQVAK